VTTRSTGSSAPPAGRAARADATPALRLVAPGDAHAAAVQHVATLAPHHRHPHVPAAECIASIEHHGLRLAAFADGTVSVAAPTMPDSPCEPLVDARLVDVLTEPDDAAGDDADEAVRRRTSTSGRFVVRYAAPDDSGALARLVSHVVDRARPSHRDPGLALHLATEHSLHIVDLATWHIGTDEAAAFVDAAVRTVDRLRVHADAERAEAAADREAVARRLRDLVDLHRDGIITDAQYTARRAAIIDSL
jgi:hypothetical protein